MIGERVDLNRFIVYCACTGMIRYNHLKGHIKNKQNGKSFGTPILPVNEVKCLKVSQLQIATQLK